MYSDRRRASIHSDTGALIVINFIIIIIIIITITIISIIISPSTTSCIDDLVYQSLGINENCSDPWISPPCKTDWDKQMDNHTGVSPTFLRIMQCSLNGD